MRHLFHFDDRARVESQGSIPPPAPELRAQPAERAVLTPVDPRLFQPIADGVLHVLGFFVNFVPGHFQRAREEQLDEPVTAEDTKGERAAGVGQAGAFIGDVLGEAAFAERLDNGEGSIFMLENPGQHQSCTL